MLACPVFADMVVVGTSPSAGRLTPLEGTTVDTAIILHDRAAHFIGYLNNLHRVKSVFSFYDIIRAGPKFHYVSEELTIADWTGTLLIGLKYGDVSAAANAKATLNHCLLPSQKLYLVRSQHAALEEWINPAVTALLTAKKGSLTATDFNILGGEIMERLQSFRAELDRHRNYLVIKIFNVVHSVDHCRGADKCKAVWSLAWVAAARIHLCNETEEGSALMTRLTDIEIPGMTKECHDTTLSALAHSGTLNRYWRIIEDAVESISKLL